MVRNYDSPDPGRVVNNIRKVLTTGDMTLLDKGAYEFLITHCGFIAHYNQGGFIATYKQHLPHFIEQFLSQHGGMGWDPYLDNPRSYLYDVSYKGQMLADIIRELIPIFKARRPWVQAEWEAQQLTQKEAELRRLAAELGYGLVKPQKKAA